MKQKTIKGKKVFTESVSYSYNEQEIIMVKESDISHGSWNYSQSEKKSDKLNSENERIQHETVNFSFPR